MTSAFPPVRRLVLATIAFILIAALRAHADDPAWFVQHWQSSEGLPNHNVVAAVQTADAHLWLLMPDCLARFDGTRFERFAPEEFGGDAAHRLRAIIRGRDDALWIASDGHGVICLRNGMVRKYAVGDSQSRVNSLIEDGNGAIWITTTAGKVARISDGQLTQFGAADGLPQGSRCSLSVDSHGAVWFAKNGQVCVYRGGSFQVLLHLNSPATRLAKASSGGMWICCGLQLFKYNEGSSLLSCGMLQPPEIRGESSAMLEDRAGNLWIGTTSSGLLRYDGARFERVEVADREVSSLLEDREGNLWVSTVGGGLSRVSRKGVVMERAKIGDASESMQSVCVDATGVLWGATSNGFLVRRSNEGWRLVESVEGKSITNVTCVTADHNGALWIGTTERELHCMQNGAIKTFGRDDGIEGRGIRALLASKTGDVWVGEDRPTAMQRIRDGKVQTFKLPENVSHLRAIAEDLSGNIWIGVQKGMLLRVVGDELVDETAQIGNPPGTIRCLHVTPDNSLWIGFSGYGLGRLRAGKFTGVRVEHGLFHNDISQIIADERGWLWCGCDRGLFKVALNELDEFADGRKPRIQSVYYGRGRGLPGLQASYGDWPGAARSRDGMLWIAMRSGLAVVDPIVLRNDSPPPPVLLKKISVDDSPIASYGGAVPIAGDRRAAVLDLTGESLALKLSPRYRRLEVEFTALSLGAPENVQFRCLLEGFDRDWSPPTTQRTVSYPRLEPGDYRFRVMACNSDGVWNEKGAVVTLAITPFLWQRTWFQLAILAGFTCAVAASVRYVSFRRLRTRLRLLQQEAALDKERTRIARDLHDDLGSRLTNILLLSELTTREGTAETSLDKGVQQMSNKVRQVIRSLDETVWAINPRNDTLADLIDYISHYAVEFLQPAGIQCFVELPECLPKRTVPADARHHLYLIVKEILNNVVRHAHATEVWLEVDPQEHALHITVRDNGQGFDHSPHDGSADGLRNMRQRIQEVDGDIEVQSSLGAGTTVRLVYPWSDAFVANGSSNHHS